MEAPCQLVSRQRTVLRQLDKRHRLAPIAAQIVSCNADRAADVFAVRRFFP
jgi:hypothetical protein